MKNKINYTWMPETPEQRTLGRAINRLYRLKDEHQAAKNRRAMTGGTGFVVNKLADDIKKCEAKIIRLEKEIRHAAIIGQPERSILRQINTKAA